MTTTSGPAPEGEPDPDKTETESHDTVFVEFTDADIEFGPWPVRDVILRHAPKGLRESAAGSPAPPPADPALADCLLGSARVLVKRGEFARAVPKAAEAAGLYRRAGGAARLADALRVLAEAHEALRNFDTASELFAEEEAIRRRLAA